MTPAIHSILDRLHQIEQLFETLTDTAVLTQDAIKSEYCPEAWPYDLATFKAIVERGVMKSAKFKPPHGYKVLSFLTLLSFLQDEQREKDWLEERDEMNRLFKTMQPEAQSEFKTWLRKPHFEISFSQTVQIFKNA